MNHPPDKPDSATKRALLWIIAAAATAHIWCLGSQFYLDDLIQIRDNEQIRDFLISNSGLNTWTDFWYGVQAWVFNMSPVGFHAVNWLLHTAIACVLYVSGRDYLRGRAPAGVALFAAMLFAVHPLGSEIPNYARTQDLAWVTLFSLLAAWRFFLALNGGGLKQLVWSVVCIIGATFSKGPGFMHALMMTTVIGLAFMRKEHHQILRKHLWTLVVLSCAGLASLWKFGLFIRIAQGLDPRVIGHAYTICRVFWEFVARSLLPVNLCADHHIAETLVPPATLFDIADTGALWAASGMAAFTVLALVLAWRNPTRVLGVCLFLYAGTMLMRILYFIPEFMPEYRIYPGLPWFCLAIALVLTWAWQAAFRNTGRIAAAILLALLAMMSAKRSFLYHDLNDLMTDVLDQYPGQLRAVWIMQRNDFDAGRWQLVIDRQQRLVPKVTQAFHQKNSRLKPRRELPTGHFAMAEVGCWSLYARAIAEQQSPATGLNEINRLEAYMLALRLDPKAHGIHWSIFYHAKGHVLEAVGNYAEAARFLTKDQDASMEVINDHARITRKLEQATRQAAPAQ